MTKSEAANVKLIQSIVTYSESYKLDMHYCVFCAESVVLGDWMFVCEVCTQRLIEGEYSMPALWIMELFFELHPNTKKRVR